jgi:hemin uptake protein HemP
MYAPIIIPMEASVAATRIASSNELLVPNHSLVQIS